MMFLWVIEGSVRCLTASVGFAFANKIINLVWFGDSNLWKEYLNCYIPKNNFVGVMCFSYNLHYLLQILIS